MATSPTRSIPRRERGAHKGPNVDRALRGNTIAWFRYQRAFDAARAELEAMGARLRAGDHRRPLATS